MTKFTKRESAIFQFGFLVGLGVATICFVVYIFSSSWFDKIEPMRRLLALFLMPQFISGEVFYLECKDYIGNQTEIVKIDTDKKKFIFDKDYLTGYTETEL